MNIILDTNVIKYMYEKNKDSSKNVELNGKIVLYDRLLELFSKAEIVFVPSEALFEILYQSYISTKSDYQFAEICEFMRRLSDKHGSKLIYINSLKGFNFSFSEFADKYNKNQPTDLSTYFNSKAENECRVILNLISLCITAYFSMIFDCIYDVNFSVEFWNRIFSCVKEKLCKLYNDFYFNKEAEKNTDKLVDELIYDVIENISKQIKAIAALYGELFPCDSKVKSGAEYISIMVEKINKSRKYKSVPKKPIDIFEEELNQAIQLLYNDKNYNMIELKYYKYLIMKLVKEKRKIRRNDAVDSSIIGILDTKSNIFEKYCNNEFVFLSFDKTIFNFCQENKIMYNQKIFDDLIEN